MNFNFAGIGAGALGGFLAAVIVDLNAWKHSVEQGQPHQFDWRLAIGRWAAGTISGAVAGLGLGNIF